MAPDSGDIKIQNAPLMTGEQQAMLSNLLSGYGRMMNQTTFGQPYPGAIRSGYTPKKYTATSYKGTTNSNPGWNWKAGPGPGPGPGPNPNPAPPGGPAPEPYPQPGQPEPGPTPSPMTIAQLLAGQYTNPLVSPYLYGLTGNYPKQTRGY